MKRFWIQMVIFGAAISILAAYYMFLRMQWVDEEVLYRAQIARMLSLMKYEPEECENQFYTYDDKNLPADITKDSWYGKYAITVMTEGWMDVSEDGLFHPGEVFSYRDLKEIMKAFYISKDSLTFSLQFCENDAMVPKSRWYEVFRLIIVNSQKIKKNTYYVYETSSTSKNLQPWQILTEQGVLNAEGIAMDPYVGSVIEVYTAEDQILGVICKLQNKPDEREHESPVIRVILHERENDYEHESVKITSEHDFYVLCGQDIWKYDAGQIFELNKKDSIFEQGDIRIKCIQPEGKIQLLSLERACGVPAYNGDIILQSFNEKMIVINEVQMEDYVAGVLPGEMPMSYDMEALKAQAVCIRTYAKRSLTTNFKEYPAHVDDTVSTQVYNNQLACKESIQAVSETKGMVLKNSNGYTPTYFFSTSCGHTSTPEDVWYDGNKSEAENSCRFLTNESVDLNLKDETQFRSFINRDNSIDYFEQDLPWFRWQVFISNEMIEEKVKEQTGSSIGGLLSVQILERGEGGVIKSLLIKGDDGEEVIMGEYAIRKIFSPEGAELRAHTGKIETNWQVLPSGYFYLDALVENNQCEGYLVHGGGYGHGCGLSQNGAMKMAEMGKNYDEILKYFFSDSNIVHE